MPRASQTLTNAKRSAFVVAAQPFGRLDEVLVVARSFIVVAMSQIGSDRIFKNGEQQLRSPSAGSFRRRDSRTEPAGCLRR